MEQRKVEVSPFLCALAGDPAEGKPLRSFCSKLRSVVHLRVGRSQSEGAGWGCSLALSPRLGSSVASASTGPAISSPASTAFPSLLPGEEGWRGFVLPTQTGSSSGRAACGQTLKLCSWGEEWPPLCGGELEVGLVTQDGGLRRGVPGLSLWTALVLGKGRGYAGSWTAWGSGGSSLETRVST